MEAVLSSIVTALAGNPAFLLLAIVLVGTGLLFWKISMEILRMFRKHLTEIENKFDQATMSVQKMADDLNGLKNTLEKFSSNAEVRFEYIERRVDRLEKRDDVDR